MEQTVEFQSFRMRTFMLKGKSPCSWKGNSFMVLEPQNLIVQRCRSKAFSPACLFRFSKSSALYPIATQPLEGEGSKSALHQHGSGSAGGQMRG